LNVKGYQKVRELRGALQKRTILRRSL